MECYSRKTDEKIESCSKKTEERMNDFSRKADELLEKFMLITNTVGNQIQGMNSSIVKLQETNEKMKEDGENKFNQFDERIMDMERKMVNRQHIDLLSMYFPHSKYSDHHIEKMYKTIEKHMTNNKKCIPIIGGDFNAELGPGRGTEM